MNIKKTSGFSLIELSIVLVIIGLLVGGFFAGLETQQKRQRLEITESRVADFQKKMTEYLQDIPDDTAADKEYTRWNPTNTIRFSDAVHYPCPARPDLTPTDPGFGLEERVPGTDRCRVVGGIVRVTGTAGGNVYIGAMPAVTLGLGGEHMKDGYNNKYTYAVSETVSDGMALRTDPTLRGSIIIRDGTGTTVSSNAEFFLTSHGESKTGAYPFGGTARVGCTAGTAEFENCNDTNAIFVASSTVSEGGTASQFYDDRAVFTLTNVDDTNSWWDLIPSSTTDIYNLNTGSVVVGTSTPPTPTAKFHVEGTGAVRGNTNIGTAATPASNPRLYVDGNTEMENYLRVRNGISIGRNSTIAGSTSLAIGSSSSISARSSLSMAIGTNSIVDVPNGNGFALGWASHALGSHGYAFGPYTEATAWGTYAFGDGARALNNWSMAFSAGGPGAAARAHDGPAVDSYATMGFFLGENRGLVANQSYSFIINSSWTSGPTVGINTTTPRTTLDVNGDIKLSMHPRACNSTTSGTLRYTGSNLQLCDGARWRTVILSP